MFGPEFSFFPGNISSCGSHEQISVEIAYGMCMNAELTVGTYDNQFHKSG